MTFKKDKTKTQFEKTSVQALASANRVMTADFAGTGYDPNFDAGVDGFINYLHLFTDTKWNDFTDEQIEVIKEIYNL